MAVKQGLRQIALYGKGSIGKSTIASNMSLALREMGHTVMQVGCSPKSDSTTYLISGDLIDNNILDFSREKGMNEELIMQCVMKGDDGIYCAESGGPEPGSGCAGRGVALALDYLKKYNVIERTGVDVVIYDAIADVVCGGFGQPMKKGYAEEVYVVTSGELMSIYSANNICMAVKTVAEEGSLARIGGMIANLRGVENEIPLLEEFARRVSVPVMGVVPRSHFVQLAEAKNKTVLKAFPDSELAGTYRQIAKKIFDNKERVIPTPITLEEIMDMAKNFQSFDLAS